MYKKKTKIILIHSRKGGVGKSVIAKYLVDVLSKKSKKVLLLDFDDQNNALLYAGIDTSALHKHSLCFV